VCTDASAVGPRELVHACRTIIRAFSSRTSHPDFSFNQQRILLEIGAHAGTDIADLRAALDIDAGQLSRAVRDLKAVGAVEVRKCVADRRRRTVAMTEAGRRAYEQLDSLQKKAIGELFSDAERVRLLAAMATLLTALRRSV